MDLKLIRDFSSPADAPLYEALSCEDPNGIPNEIYEHVLEGYQSFSESDWLAMLVRLCPGEFDGSETLVRHMGPSPRFSGGDGDHYTFQRHDSFGLSCARSPL